jgi:hypothetical protein
MTTTPTDFAPRARQHGTSGSGDDAIVDVVDTTV